MSIPIIRTMTEERFSCIVDLVREHLNLNPWNISYQLERTSGEWFYLLRFRLDNWYCQITIAEVDINKRSILELANGVISAYNTERRYHEGKK